MMAAKYKVGDEVQIRSDLVQGEAYGGFVFSNPMSRFVGKTVKIACIYEEPFLHYCIEEDSHVNAWNDEMFEDILPARNPPLAIEEDILFLDTKEPTKPSHRDQVVEACITKIMNVDNQRLADIAANVFRCSDNCPVPKKACAGGAIYCNDAILNWIEGVEDDGGDKIQGRR